MGAKVGHKVTEETRRKISVAFKGRKLTQAHKDKISKGNMGTVRSPEAILNYKKSANDPLKNGTFRKGLTPWNKGKKHPKVAGVNNKNWKGGTQSESSKQRVGFGRYSVPRVFERDDYTCQICLARNGNGKKIILHVDHIKRWADYPELRFNMDNCRTVCRPCHYYLTFKKDMPAKCKWGLSPNWSASEKIR